jgi:methionyl-tRNA formyltransferase
MGENIVGVITKEKSNFNSDFRDITPICRLNNIEYLYVNKINHKENIEWIRGHNPDIIFCFGWSQILAPELLSIPHLGVIGYHPAKLPNNRGRHPLVWALCLGLKETGSTFFFMDKGADTGDILSQELIEIDEDDNAQSLYNKMIHVSLKQIDIFLPELKSGNYKRIHQDKEKGNTWRKRVYEDGIIDWRMSAETIHNLVRGLTRPYVGANFEYDGKNIIVWKTKICMNKDYNIEPGKVIGNENGFPKVKCGIDSIILEEIEPVITIKEGAYL